MSIRTCISQRRHAEIKSLTHISAHNLTLSLERIAKSMRECVFYYRLPSALFKINPLCRDERGSTFRLHECIIQIRRCSSPSPLFVHFRSPFVACCCLVSSGRLCSLAGHWPHTHLKCEANFQPAAVCVQHAKLGCLRMGS